MNLKITNHTYQKELEVSVQAALAAGDAILSVYESENFGVEYKEDDSPLTKADRASNAIIGKALREAFPTHAILSEEDEDDRARLDNPLCFVVDPLDGTKEFVKRNGEFTVNIALAKDHESILGVIYVPVSRELYYAAQGAGAYYQKMGEEPVQIHTTDVLYSADTADAFRVVASRSHNSPLMDALIEKYHLTQVVSIGSSLKGCLVAKGDAEIYYRHNPTMEWDTAAMQCIAEEAGAVFRQMDDTPMRYNRENTRNEKGFYILNRSENRLR